MGTKKIVAILMKFDGEEMDHVRQDRAQVASENITLHLHIFFLFLILQGCPQYSAGYSQSEIQF